jgi:hypothetical protein
MERREFMAALGWRGSVAVQAQRSPMPVRPDSMQGEF